MTKDQFISLILINLRYTIIRVFSLLPIVIVFNGYVFSIMWSWFIVPFGIIEISIVHAIGISMIFGIITKTIPQEGLKKDQEVRFYVNVLLKPVFALIFGWIAKSLM